MYKENKFMKLAKRVFIGLLAVAILVSSIAVAISAESGKPAFDDILKYYDPATSTVYIDEDFEGESYEGDVFNGADDQLSSRVEISAKTDDDGNPVNKYMDMISGPITNTAAVGDMLYVVNLNDQNGDPTKLSTFVFDVDVMASHYQRSHVACSAACGYDVLLNSYNNIPAACPTCGAAVNVRKSEAPVVKIFVGETQHAEGSVAGAALLILDFQSGKMLRYDGASYAELDISISENKWYGIHVVYEQNVFELTVTDKENKGKELLFEDLITPVHYVASVKVGYASTLDVDGRDTVISLDNVYLQSGNDYRNATAEELELLTRASIAQIKDMLFDSAVSLANKFKAVEVYDKLVDVYGYTTTDADTLLNIEAIKQQTLVVYAASLNDVVAGINTRNSYEDRLAYVEKYSAVAERVRSYGAELDEAAIADLNAYDLEATRLATDKEKSESFILFVQSWVDQRFDFYSNDYAVLEKFYSAVKNDYYDAASETYTYNSTYPGISTAFNNHVLVRNKFENMQSASTAFVKAVNDLNEAIDAYDSAKAQYDAVDPADADALAAAVAALSEAQTKRLSSYALARELIYENTTCPGVVGALASINSQTELQSIGNIAEKFLDLMSKAAASINIDAKEECLDVAADLLDVVANEYPGVSEAKEQYSALRQTISDSRAAAAAYIAAVNKLKGLSGNALVDAVNEALELQKTGNIIEIEGVVEANMTLDNAYSSIQFAKASAEKFITLVSYIDSNASLSDRFAAINAANAARNVPDSSLAGVSAATSTLDAAIAEYNADVAAINSAYADSAKIAADFSGASVTLGGVGAYVISFIKSLIS